LGLPAFCENLPAFAQNAGRRPVRWGLHPPPRSPIRTGVSWSLANSAHFARTRLDRRSNHRDRGSLGGRAERYSQLAAEFVRLKVDVIVTSGAAVVAAKQATSVIPIVFPAAPDPLGSSLVASLARPGGNVTGLSMQQPDLASKRLELLREVVPGLRRLTILGNVGYPSAVVEMGEVQATARTLGFEVTKLEIRRAEEIAPAFETLRGGADALYVCSEPLVNTNRVRVNTLALGARLPTMYGYREFVESGGLMSYGPNIPDLFRRAGDYVDKILRGAKPGDLPVQQPTKFDLAINLTTAKALGLTIPEAFLLRADEVIE
jgi:putative tryptophan/tyrosine transport system substrate-binding protein